MNKTPAIHQFLYQESGATAAQKFLLGYTTDKYYIHNELDYSDAAITLKPGVAFKLNTKNIQLTANDSIKIGTNETSPSIILDDTSLKLYTSLQVAPNNATPASSFSVNTTNTTLKSTNSPEFQTAGGQFNFSSGKTGNGVWCSAACFKNTYSNSNGAFDAVYVGVYKNTGGAIRWALDAQTYDGTKTNAAPLSIGMLSEKTILGANNNEGLQVETIEVEGKKKPIVKIKQDSGWKEVASKTDISGMLSNGGEWTVLDKTSNDYWSTLNSGIYLIAAFDPTGQGSNQYYEGDTPLGIFDIQTATPFVLKFSLANIKVTKQSSGPDNRSFNFVDNCIIQKSSTGNSIRIGKYTDIGANFNVPYKLKVKKLA